MVIVCGHHCLWPSWFVAVIVKLHVLCGAWGCAAAVLSLVRCVVHGAALLLLCH